MPNSRAQSITDYLEVPGVVAAEVETQLAEAAGVFDHPNGGFIDRILPTDYGLHTLSAAGLQAYQFETPGPDAAGLIAVVATSAYPHTLDGPFVGGFATATFGGSVGDALLVWVGGGQLSIVGTVNVTVKPTAFDHASGGFIDRIVTADYGVHTLSASSQTAYEFDTVGANDVGTFMVVATTAHAHTVAGTFVGGFTTATFGGAVGDTMTVYVNGGLLYVVSLVNVTLS